MMPFIILEFFPFKKTETLSISFELNLQIIFFVDIYGRYGRFHGLGTSVSNIRGYRLC